MSDIQQRKLGDLCTVSSSKRIYAHEYVEDGVPFYRSKEIIQKHNGDEINTELFITEERYTQIKEKFGAPSSGDMLMTSVGTLGVPYIVQPDEKFYFKDGNLTWYKDFSDELDSKYLFYLMDSKDGKELIKTVTIGSSQAALTIDGMKGLMIPCPTKEHQKKIVKTLTVYDDLVENNNCRIAILEEMAQRLYREWFVHFRFPGHENVEMVDSELGMIPEGWHVCMLKDIAGLKYGKALRNENRLNGDIPVYGSSGIVGYHSEPLVGGPGIIVGRKGNVGSVYFSFDDFYPIDTVFYIETKVELAYLFYLLKNMTFFAGDTAVPGLNRESTLNTKILLPNPEIIDSFDRYCFTLLKKSVVLKNANTVLRKTRDHLFPHLISGNINVSKIEL